ncbi:hypothetical protein AMAG_06573 [Allomyces macrogynus ATCC 38327]|uniref:Exocyst complex component 8 n=1 Tax=Allomyces macrogynus (strain ATCC 38327) TaxID=578462 RepID=A0A0L0SH47_ALLM3|nr:hypothetical protein AMAG_06573 [Allomyces macrogynus ATCC 38327]|eukprot:KNE61774.1 hypothetical protein AMAG_06573 [Allomyces macrogynus ATCC 38327]
MSDPNALSPVTTLRRNKSRMRTHAVAEARAQYGGAPDAPPLPTPPSLARSGSDRDQLGPALPALIPKKSDARQARGHRRDQSWAAKFGSGNWKSLVGGAPPSPTSEVGSNVSGMSGVPPPLRARQGSGFDSVASGRSGGSGGPGGGASAGGYMSGTDFEADAKRFFDERFQPEEYVRNTMHSNSEEGVRQFYRLLQTARETAAQNLKSNVYKNYAEFVAISKEIAQLETDMLVLRGLLSDLRSVHDHFRSTAGLDAPADTGSLDQSGAGSTMQLVATNSSAGVPWATDAPSTPQELQQQLQRLMDDVENASKALPPNPARMLVYTGVLIELDASYRFKNTVQLYVLSDYLFVSAKRRRGLKSRYVADKCWAWSEVTVLDVRDTPDVSMAFKIVRNSSQFLFKCDAAADKKQWLHLLKRAIDTWGSGDTTGAAEEGASASPSGRDDDSIVGALTINTRTGPPKPSKEIEAKLSEQLDELDVLISSRDFDAAIQLIHVLQGHSQLPARIDQLASLLLRDLALPHGGKRHVQTTMRRLCDLGHTVPARTALLELRTRTLHDSARQLRFQGDLPRYVHELGTVLIQGVKKTAEWYEAVLPDPLQAAFLAEWATDHVKEFAEALVRQVGDESLKVVVACLDTSVTLVRSLDVVGLDLEFVFWDCVAAHVARAIEAFERQCAELLARSVIEDSFAPWRNDYHDGITKSMMQFCKTMLDFLNFTKFFQVIPMFQLQLVGCVTGLSEAFFNWLTTIYNEKPLDKDQMQAILTSCEFLARIFLPKVVHQLEKTFQYRLPALAAVSKTMHSTVAQIKAASDPAPRPTPPPAPPEPAAAPAAAAATTNDSPPSSASGTLSRSLSRSGGALPVDAAPVARPRRPTRDRSMRRLARSASGSMFNLAHLADDAQAEIDLDMLSPSPSVRALVASNPAASAVEQVLTTALATSVPTGTALSVARVTQLVLDIHYLLKSLPPQALTDAASNAAQDLCERALRAYLAVGDAGLLKSGEWYEERVDTAIREARVARASPSMARRQHRRVPSSGSRSGTGSAGGSNPGSATASSASLNVPGAR